MTEQINISSWFTPDPNNKGECLVSPRGVLLLAFQYKAEEPNESITMIVNSIISIANSNGYKGELELRRILNNKIANKDLMARHVEVIFNFVGEDVIMEMIEGSVN